MATTTMRARRWLTPITASLTTLALLASCGGSKIEQEAAGPVGATEQTESSGTSTAPVEGQSTGVSADSRASAGAEAATNGEGAVPAPGAGAAKPVSPGNAGTPTKGKGTTGTGKTAVGAEGIVASNPIFGGNAPCKPATLAEIPIGNVSTLSGVLGELFAPAVPAFHSFFAAANACGGLNGHKIKFYQADDQGDPSTAASKTQELIRNKKVLALVGNIQVLTIDAIVPVVKREGIPVIGGDLVSGTWFSNPMLFPQGGAMHSIAYGYLSGIKDYFKGKDVGTLWCIEVPRACEQVTRALKELAPKFGIEVKRDSQVSLTAPSYVQQCLDFKNAGVTSVVLSMDAASDNRIARSCQQVGWHPNTLAHPLGVGNDKQFFGNEWLGNTYVPMNVFPHFDTSTPAEKYFQATMKKYSPGAVTGGSASFAWTAAALLIAAGSKLDASTPTTQQLLQGLYEFQGQKFTQLAGLSPAPLTFREGANPRVPYCLYYGITNEKNTAWARASSKPSCTDLVAPSDPQSQP